MNRINGHLSKLLAGCVIGAALAVCGCGKSVPPAAKVKTDTKAFDSASAEIKAEWSKVVTAAEAKDYATVILTCKKLYFEPELTPEQRDAAQNTGNAFMTKMQDDATNGDEKAKEAIHDVQEASFAARSAHQ
jgi:hypothetical protein